jgi:phenylpropionate dioxygenase-like ring-hydroxylating dioxygenase large terminal subunit
MSTADAPPSKSPPRIAMPPSIPVRMPQARPNGGGSAPQRPAGGVQKLKTRMVMEGPEKGGWHQNWFALCKSEEVRAGELKSMMMFGSRILATRLADGTPKVFSGICRHLGADMGFGGIVHNEDIVCPFHHWRYNINTGAGRINGFNQTLPVGTGLFSFPTAERWGMVWAFNGPQPLYDVPGFDGVENDNDLDFQVMQMPSPLNQEVWVPFSNSNDFTHLRFLHRVTQFKGPDNHYVNDTGSGHDISFRMPSGRVYDHRVRTHGTNCIAMAVTVDGSDEAFMNLFTATPTDEGMQTTVMITAVPKILGQEKIADLSRESREYGMTLGMEDGPVIGNSWFGPDTLMEVDHELKLYFDFIRKYPLHDPFRPCRSPGG